MLENRNIKDWISRELRLNELEIKEKILNSKQKVLELLGKDEKNSDFKSGLLYGHLDAYDVVLKILDSGKDIWLET